MKTLWQHLQTVRRNNESADRVTLELKMIREVKRYEQSQGFIELVVKSSEREVKTK